MDMGPRPGLSPSQAVLHGLAGSGPGMDPAQQQQMMGWGRGPPMHHPLGAPPGRPPPHMMHPQVGQPRSYAQVLRCSV